MLDLAFRPDRDRAEPLYRQLGSYLRGLIAAERLPRGGKLPATRELATSLGLSRNTVAQAYDELLADGILTAHVGQGTFVAPQATAPRADDETPPRTRGFVWSGLFAHRARALALPGGARALYPAGPHRFDFRGGQVATDCLPADDLKRAFAEALRRHLKDLARLLDPLGWLPLRKEIARWLVGRGIECTPAEVAIVNGAQQAIDLVARVLIDPGDTVVMEQPGYFGASLAFTASQANVVGVGVDDDGLRTEELARVLRARRAKLIYATPAAQSPTGAVLSDELRRGHHAADAQAREEHLRERRGVDHLAGGVGAFERRGDGALVTELAVVVVLEDGHLVLVGEREERAPPLVAQDDAGRRLRRGRRVD